MARLQELLTLDEQDVPELKAVPAECTLG